MHSGGPPPPSTLNPQQTGGHPSLHPSVCPSTHQRRQPEDEEEEQVARRMSLQRLNPKDEKLPINSVNLRVKYPPVCDLVTFPSAAEVTPPPPVQGTTRL